MPVALRRVLFSMVVACLFCFLTTSAMAEVMLQTNKPAYNPGDDIVLSFMGLPGNSSDWITLVPAGSAHDEWGDWFYTEGQVNGTHTFTNVAAGDYEIRVYFNWSEGGYVVQSALPVSVGTGTATPSAVSDSLSLNQTSVAPGASIAVNFTTRAGLPNDAWVGIIPSDVPHGDEATNDGHDVAYQYLNSQTSGTLTFTAPSQPGQYDFRMHDTDAGGVELASVSFTVGQAEATLTLTQTNVAPGASISVNFTTKSPLASDAWIGIIPSDVPHGDEATNDGHDVAYQYLDGKTSGTLTFTAPSQAGQWDFRMHNTDAGGIELASVSFIVEQGEASLSLEQTSVAPGDPITVSFTTARTLPNDAWVGIIPSGILHGDETLNDANDVAYQYLSGLTSGSLTFTAPAQSGQYDFRLHDTDAGGVELASVSFTVAPAGNSLTLQKSVFAPGESITVTFTADPTFPSNAWVGIIPANIPHGDEATNDGHDVAYQYLEGHSAGTLTFTAPSQPGQWDLRMHDTDSGGREVTYATFIVQ